MGGGKIFMHKRTRWTQVIIFSAHKEKKNLLKINSHAIHLKFLIEIYYI